MSNITGQLSKAHQETRDVLVNLTKAYNHFVSRGFMARFRWLLFGK